MKFTNVIMTAAISMVSMGCKSTAAQNDLPQNSTPQVFTFESDGNGFNTKNFFYDNGQEVVVFDTQFTPETARKSLDFLRTKTQNPVTYVVITHPNPDKFNGMGVFQALGAKVIASVATAASMKGVHDYKKYYFVNMAKMFSEDTYPKLSNVDATFEKTMDLRLKNGEVIQLAELAKPGVSSNQTIASITKLNALIVGDLIHHNAHAWLEGGIVKGKPTPTIKGWIADLDELVANYKSSNPLVYGGRGEAGRLDQVVPAQIAYLKTADALVTKYVKSLGAKKKELSGEKAATHHQALQAQFEKAFPGYQLGYMIQYGVYGLANSKL